MLKKQHLLIVITFLAVFLVGTGYAQQASQSQEQIPILAWYGIPPGESTVERYVELRESGITHNYTHFSSADDLAVALDAAAEAGIKMSIHCPELQSEPEKTVSRFKDHPALGGYHLVDEPSRGVFPQLGEWARKIQAVDDQHFCYINLLPNYASSGMLGTETYREHVQLFIKEVPVPFVSFDYYPVVEVAPGERVLRGSWYENLEIVSDEARKAGKPFWAFALTVAHNPYPIPTPAELRLQVYSNLAYGAQGIQYFTYWTPGPNQHWNFHHAPITYDTAQRTEVFDYIKEINGEIKNLSFVFLNAEVVSVAHTGENIPQGTTRLEKLPEVIKTFETEGEGAVVSVLQKDGKSYLVVVNRDFKNNMTVKIEGEPGLQRVLKDGTMVPASAYISTLVVAPGDILIYCWNNQREYYQSKVGMWYTIWWDSLERDPFFYEHHWGKETRVKPIKHGYYATDDPEKLKDDFQFFHRIGIDYLILDDTNAHFADGGNLARHIDACFTMAKEMGEKAPKLCFAGGRPLIDGNIDGMQAELDIFAGYAEKYRDNTFFWKGKPLFVNFNIPQNYSYQDKQGRFTMRPAAGHLLEGFPYRKEHNLEKIGKYGWVFDMQYEKSEVHGITPGFSRSHNDLGTTLDPIERENGQRYQREWLAAVKRKPEMIVISSWNDHAEETGIEAVELLSPIPGRGEEDPFFYEKITEGYLALKTGYLENWYYRNESESQVYQYREGKLHKVATPDKKEIVIVVPDDYYDWAEVPQN